MVYLKNRIFVIDLNMNSSELLIIYVHLSMWAHPCTACSLSLAAKIKEKV